MINDTSILTWIRDNGYWLVAVVFIGVVFFVSMFDNERPEDYLE